MAIERAETWSCSNMALFQHQSWARLATCGLPHHDFKIQARVSRVNTLWNILHAMPASYTIKQKLHKDRLFLSVSIVSRHSVICETSYRLKRSVRLCCDVCESLMWGGCIHVFTHSASKRFYNGLFWTLFDSHFPLIDTTDYYSAKILMRISIL